MNDNGQLITDRPRVVIVGAGFGGLWAARALGERAVDVRLVDRNNYHTFLPLLYQVAAAELEPEQIAYPIRSIVHALPNVQFTLGTVTAVDLDRQTVTIGDEPLPYDYLILALGSTSAYFGVPGAAEHTFDIKSVDGGIRLRNHILRLFERATQTSDPATLRRLLTFVIVGGGPTGVEYAGALQELIQKPLARDFPTLDVADVRVILVEGRDRLLSGMPANLGAYARRRLEQMGVDIELESLVTAITPAEVRFQDGRSLDSATVVWTAGVRGHPLAEAAGLPLDDARRVTITPNLQLPDHPNVYVIGDMAAFPTGGEALPMLAPVATQQGDHAAANILRHRAGHPPLPFAYNDRGQMATVGRNAAVAEILGRTFTGFFAWLIWLGIHLFNLIGFRNRLMVLINWAWNYFFFERVVRLILPTAVVEEDEFSAEET